MQILEINSSNNAFENNNREMLDIFLHEKLINIETWRQYP